MTEVEVSLLLGYSTFLLAIVDKVSAAIYCSLIWQVKLFQNNSFSKRIDERQNCIYLSNLTSGVKNERILLLV